MFDFHLHSTVSFDGKSAPAEMALAARDRGLREICFTDHIDRDIYLAPDAMTFRTEDYNAAYDSLTVPGLTIRRGIEFGMKPGNRQDFDKALQRRPFDFVLGSVHFVKELNAYKEPFWQGKTVEQAERDYLEEMLTCVQVHDQFDVLAHLNFLSKSKFNPGHIPMHYEPHREILDAILELLVQKGKGLEINTSGICRNVGFLPGKEFFVRFRELGGQIVTMGSDAHQSSRVGEHIPEAAEILRDVFGYVCTYENRQPVFHKL